MTSDKIELNDLEVNCVIGVNDTERTKPQRLQIRVELGIDTEAAARTDLVAETVDYEFIASQIHFVLHMGQFHLLETACHALCRTLLLPPVEGEYRAAVESARIRIDKPEGLKHRAVPSVEILRHRADLSYHVRNRDFGILEVVFESAHIGIYRSTIAAGATIPPHMNPLGEEAEMLLGDGLEIQGETGRRGSIRFWPKCLPHSYRNATERPQPVLRMARPACADAELAQGEGRPAESYTLSELGARELSRRWPVVT